MKKVARLRSSPTMSEDQRQHSIQNIGNEPTVRTTGRIKKPKAVFDPSDNYLPRAQRLPAVLAALSTGCNVATLSQDNRNALSRMSTTSSENSMAKEVCVVCGKRESKRTSFAIKNPLLSCLDCEGKMHRLCLKADFDDFERIRQTYRCEVCTPCAICLENGQTSTVNDSNVLVCSKCAKVYHCQCLQSSSGKQAESQVRDWKCPKCTSHLDVASADNLPAKKIREIIGDHTRSPPPPNKLDSITTTPISNVEACENDSQGAIHTDERVSGRISKTEECSKIGIIEPNLITFPSPTSDESHNHSINNVPDVQNWSVEQVFEYFTNHFPKEAHVFKDQEIDGPSLLLLKRSDVVKKLPLKLGPSLRLYSAILKIQGQQNDPTMGWN